MNSVLADLRSIYGHQLRRNEEAPVDPRSCVARVHIWTPVTQEAEGVGLSVGGDTFPVMSICVACSSWGDSGLCLSCRSQLRASSPVREAGIEVVSGFVHEKTARRLVHLLKYQGITAAGVILATVMAARLPPGTTALVPVPRATLRRIRYGIDPALELAHRIGTTTGVDVVSALAAPMWWPSHAGGNRDARRHPRFRRIRNVPAGAVMVDDVLTTGATLAAAGAVLGVRTALTATQADSRWFE